MTLSQVFGVITFLSLFYLANSYTEKYLKASDHCFCKVSSVKKRKLYTLERQVLAVEGVIR
jgi:hypothetical protein